MRIFQKYVGKPYVPVTCVLEIHAYNSDIEGNVFVFVTHVLGINAYFQTYVTKSSVSLTLVWRFN